MYKFYRKSSRKSLQLKNATNTLIKALANIYYVIFYYDLIYKSSFTQNKNIKKYKKYKKSKSTEP